MIKKWFLPTLTTDKLSTIETTSFVPELLSLHIPKTAGTSFRNTLKSAYGDNQVLRVDIGLVSDELRVEQKIHADRRLPIGARVLHGHFQVPELYKRLELPDNLPVITWLRNPVDRVVSNYYYLAARLREELNEAEKGINLLEKMQRSLMEYAAYKPHQNRISQFLAGRTLESFLFIGFTETYFEDLTNLAAILQWSDYEPFYQNQTPSKSDDLDMKDLDLIRELNQDDIKLYEQAMNLKEKGFWKP